MSSPRDVAGSLTCISTWKRQEIKFFDKAASCSTCSNSGRRDGVCDGTAISNAAVLLESGASHLLCLYIEAGEEGCGRGKSREVGTEDE